VWEIRAPWGKVTCKPKRGQNDTKKKRGRVAALLSGKVQNRGRPGKKGVGKRSR